jgi:Na+/H+ antiporter NhaD/arsenite permease-like protein
VKDHCPACEREVEYEGAGANSSCSICGRTRSAAEKTAHSRKRERRAIRFRWVRLTAAILVGCVIVAYYVFDFLSASEAAKSGLIAVALTGAVVSFLAWLFRGK